MGKDEDDKNRNLERDEPPYYGDDAYDPAPPPDTGDADSDGWAMYTDPAELVKHIGEGQWDHRLHSIYETSGRKDCADAVWTRWGVLAK